MRSKRSDKFEERFIRFSVEIIALIAHHPDLPASVASQVIRSAGSIGANYAEAQSAISRADFRNKISIAKKEAAETYYWLRIIQRLVKTSEISRYVQGSQEFLLILQKVIKTLGASRTA